MKREFATLGPPLIRDRPVGWLDPALLLALLTALWVGTAGVPPWGRMWLLVGGEVLAVKWLLLRHARSHGCQACLLKQAAFLFAWAGTDAKRFLNPNVVREKLAGTAREWRWAFAKLVAGVVLLLTGARLVAVHELAAAWFGMVGLVLVGHFGLVHLLSLTWRAAGVDAPPLMREPLLATSLADFWGARWNLAFALPARELIFKPLARRVGTADATLVVFATSAAFHESVISLPANGGWGMPSAYFLFQGVAVLLEKSALGRALRLGHGARGWCFMFICTAGPVCWLFHPAFALRVVLPTLSQLNSLIP